MSNPPPSPKRPGQHLASPASSPDGGGWARLRRVGALIPWEAPAAAAAVYIFGIIQRDPLDGAEAVYLSQLVLWILAAAGVVAASLDRPKTPLPWIALACVLTIWATHQGPHRGAVAGLWLLAATVWAAQAVLRHVGNVGAGATLVAWTASAAAWQTLLHSAEAVSPWTLERAVTWVVMPALAGAAAALLQARLGAPATWGVAAPVFILGSGWGPIGVGVLGLMAGAAWWLRRKTTFVDAVSSAVGPFWGLAAVASMAVWTCPALYPWLRTEPTEVFRHLPGIGPAAALLLFFGAMTRLAMRSGAELRHILPFTFATMAVAVATLPLPRTEVLSEGQPQVLTVKRPRLEWPLPPGPLRSVVVEVDLVHGAELPPRSLALRVLWQQDDRKLLDTFLRSGVDIDDWASGRTDLASRPGRPTVSPWHHRVSADGTFFSRTFRSSLRPPPYRVSSPATPPAQPRDVDTDGPTLHLDLEDDTVLILQRPKALPADVAVRIHRLEVRR